MKIKLEKGNQVPTKGLTNVTVLITDSPGEGRTFPAVLGWVGTTPCGEYGELCAACKELIEGLA